MSMDKYSLETPDDGPEPEREQNEVDRLNRPVNQLPGTPATFGGKSITVAYRGERCGRIVELPLGEAGALRLRCGLRPGHTVDCVPDPNWPA